MDSKKILKIGGIFLPAFIFLFFVSFVYADILNDVKNLKIGVDGFFIGEKLKNVKNFERVKKFYPGTLKFRYKNLYITVTKKEKIIVGLYKKFDNASFEDLKKTISFLMIKFGEPTIEAHGKTIYWFYSKNGKISNEEFLKQKEKGTIKKPLLMIKFHSNKFISDKNSDSKYSFYFIIYSEGLIREFIKR